MSEEKSELPSAEPSRQNSSTNLTNGIIIIPEARSRSHSTRSSRKSAKSLRSLKSNRSIKSTQSIRVFNHDHSTYMTCFGCMHVKIATCLVGFLALIAVCLSLIYTVVVSQEHRRPNVKFYAIPMIIVIIALLFMFIGILQQKASHLYPFITLQIFFVFAIAVAIIMVAIAVMCNTKIILQLIVDTSLREEEYKRSAVISMTGMGSQLILQLWALRAVCGCFRYYTDIAKFDMKQQQQIYNFV